MHLYVPSLLLFTSASVRVPEGAVTNAFTFPPRGTTDRASTVNSVVDSRNTPATKCREMPRYKITHICVTSTLFPWIGQLSSQWKVVVAQAHNTSLTKSTSCHCWLVDNVYYQKFEFGQSKCCMYVNFLWFLNMFLLSVLCHYWLNDRKGIPLTAKSVSIISKDSRCGGPRTINKLK